MNALLVAQDELFVVNKESDPHFVGLKKNGSTSTFKDCKDDRNGNSKTIMHDVCHLLFSEVHDHDLSFSSLGYETDPEDSNLSPDLILENVSYHSGGHIFRNKSVVFELKTKLHGDFSNEEYEMYYNLYKKSSSKDDRFSSCRMIILIGENFILSSFSLSEEMLSKIGIFRSDAHYVRSLVISNGFHTMDIEDQEKLRIFKESISKCKFRSSKTEFGLDAAKLRALIEKYDNRSLSDFSMINEAMIDLVNKEFDGLENLESFFEKVKDVESNVGTKTFSKPIVKFPWLFPSKNIQKMTELPVDFIAKDNKDSLVNATSSLIQNLLVKAFSEGYSPKILDEGNYEPIEEVLLYDDADSYSRDFEQKLRNKALYDVQRVYCEVDPDEKVHLATAGICGKEYSTHLEKKLAEAESSRVYGYHSTSTSDIYDYIRDTNSWMETRKECKLVKDPIEIDLLKMEADYICRTENDDSYSEILRMSSNPDFVASTIISHIAFELNAALRKPTKKDSYYIVKLRHFPIILITCCSKAYLFYSIVIRKSDFIVGSLPFSEMHDAGPCLFTRFYSTNRSDITSPLLCNAKFCAKAAISSEIYFNDSSLSKESLCEARALHLIDLENKETTTAPTSNIRYIFMKSIAQDKSSKPDCVLSKYSPIIRSRLYLFILKNTISFLEITKDVKIMNIRSESVDKQSGVELSQNYLDDRCFSVTSLNKVRRMETLINLMYSSWYHDKNKSEHTSSNRSIVEKVCKEEVKMRKAVNCTVPSDLLDSKILNADFKSHEFDPSYLIFLSNNLRLKMLKINPNYLEDLYVRLSKKLVMEFATLKASADYQSFVNVYDHDSVKYGSHKFNKRIKCLSAVLRMIDDFDFSNTESFSDMEKLFSIVETCSGVVVNLFKKNQRTGVREIYVMTIMSRILISFTEEINRFFCEFMENEYVSKGDQKIDDISEFQRSSVADFKEFCNNVKKVNKIREKEGGDLIKPSMICITDSMDMSSWSQQFIMPTFTLIMSKVLDDKLLSVFSSIMNMMGDKHIELPEPLLSEFQIRSAREFDSKTHDIINELKKQFNGESAYNDLVAMKGVLLKNISNFMQGVLQGGSSLGHSLHGEACAKCIDQVNQRVDFVIKSRTRSMVSSDDSAYMTFLFIDLNQLSKSRFSMDVIKLYRSSLLFSNAKRMCAKISVEKSTMNVTLPFFVEFNSIWVVTNTVVIPLIKLSRSLFDFKVSSSSVKSQQIDSGILSDMAMSGCTSKTVSIHQLLMKICSYSMLGATLNRKEHSMTLQKKISEISHPAAWFYMLSHGKTGCLLGWDFTFYFNMMRSNRMRSVEKYLRRVKLSESGELHDMNVHAHIAFGGSKKYNSFIEEVGLSDEKKRMELYDYMEREFIDGDVPLSHRKPINSLESKFKILIKALSPGVYDNFSPDDVSKFAASSVYITKKPCITLRMRNPEESDYIAEISMRKYAVNVSNEESIKVKATMMSFLNMIPLDTEFSPLEKSISPYSDFYDSIITNLNSMVVVSRDRTRVPNKQKYIYTMMTQDVDSEIISLMDCVKLSWFGIKPKYYKRSVVTDSFEKYKSRIPWIKDDRLESLRIFKSLGGNVMNLMTEIESYSSKPRNIKILSPIHHRKNPLKQILSHLKVMFSNSQILSSRDVIQSKDDVRSLYATLFSNYENSPVQSTKEIVDKMFVESFFRITRNANQAKVPESIRSMSNIFNSTGREIESPCNGSKLEDVFSKCMSVSTYIDFWSKEQNFRYNSSGGKEFYGDGIFCRYISSDDQLVFHIKDDIIIKVCYTKLYALSTNLSLVVDYLKRIGIKPNMMYGDRVVSDIKYPVVLDHSTGIAVEKIDKMDNFVMDMNIFNQISFSFNSSSISLNLDQSGRKIKLISYSPKFGDSLVSKALVEQLDSSSTSNLISKKMRNVCQIGKIWHNDETIDPTLLRKLTESLIEDDNDFEGWVVSSLIQTLKIQNQLPAVGTTTRVTPIAQSKDYELTEEDLEYASFFLDPSNLDSAIESLDNVSNFLNEPVIEESTILDKLCGVDHFQEFEMVDSANSIDMFSSIVSEISKKKRNYKVKNEQFFNLRFYDEYISGLKSMTDDGDFKNWKSIPNEFLPDSMRRNRIDDAFLKALRVIGLSRRMTDIKEVFVEASDDEEDDEALLDASMVVRTCLTNLHDEPRPFTALDVIERVSPHIPSTDMYNEQLRSYSSPTSSDNRTRVIDNRSAMVKSLIIQSLLQEMTEQERNLKKVIDFDTDLRSNPRAFEIRKTLMFDRYWLAFLKHQLRARPYLDVTQKDLLVDEVIALCEKICETENDYNRIISSSLHLDSFGNPV